MTVLATIDIPAEADLGPAMLTLTERQRRFVWACLETGEINNARHAQMAGFTGDARTLATTGHRLAHDPRVIEAMLEEGTKRMHSGVIVAVSELVRLVKDAPEVKDRLKAIDMVLNRVGLHAKTEHKLTVRREGNEAEMIGRIKALAGELGVDPQKLLGNAKVIEGDFVEVKPDEWAALPQEEENETNTDGNLR